MSLLSRYSTERGEPRVVKIFTHALIAMIAIIMLSTFWPLRSVPTGSRGVITVGGAIRGIENEGFTLIAPWQRLETFNIRAEAANIEKAEGATSDTQPVDVNLTVRYAVAIDKVAEVYEKYSHDGNLENYIQTAAQEVFKAVTARYTAPDLIAKRAQVSSDIYKALGEKVSLYGARIISIDMRNFAFRKEYTDAINAKVNQDQLLQAAEKKALTVAAEQKQKVAIAEAEASAAKAKADGEGYALLKVATAQADALKIQNAALAQNKDVLELRRIEVELAKAQKWNGALPQSIYAGAPVPFMQVK